MSCPSELDWAEFVAEELPDTARDVASAHLRTCSDCPSVVSLLTAEEAQLQSLFADSVAPPKPLDPVLEDALALRLARGGSSTWSVTAAIVVIALVVVMVGYLANLVGARVEAESSPEVDVPAEDLGVRVSGRIVAFQEPISSARFIVQIRVEAVEHGDWEPEPGRGQTSWPGLQRRTCSLKGTIQATLKGAPARAPGWPFSLRVTQHGMSGAPLRSWNSGPVSFWSYPEWKPGREYVVFSAHAGSLEAALAVPSFPIQEVSTNEGAGALRDVRTAQRFGFSPGDALAGLNARAEKVGPVLARFLYESLGARIEFVDWLENPRAPAALRAYLVTQLSLDAGGQRTGEFELDSDIVPERFAAALVRLLCQPEADANAEDLAARLRWVLLRGGNEPALAPKRIFVDEAERGRMAAGLERRSDPLLARVGRWLRGSNW